MAGLLLKPNPHCMKTLLFLLSLTFAIVCLTNALVDKHFNPDDTVKTYSHQTGAVTPPANTAAKWVKNEGKNELEH